MTPNNSESIPNTKEIQVQRRYYAKMAAQYDAMHVEEGDEHFFALSFLVGVLDYLDCRSILDIGSGTGRAIQYIKKHRPDLKVVGVEPVKELREIGYAKGLSEDELIDGQAADLAFDTSTFDMVCEFAVLHHVRNPDLVVSEMLRVAGKAIFISDSNNYGMGSLPARSLKRALNLVGLMKAVDFVKTMGKGYTASEDDGISYRYSVFDNYKQIRGACEDIHLLNTMGGQINPYTTASHVALLGVKK